jgi:hypothetical protein
MSNSILNINDLPSIDEVKKITQALALVDAIIMPEWEYRFFSFNANWDGAGREMMASMRDGSGSEYFINFTQGGVAGKVLSDDQLADASASLSHVPDSFSGFKSEPAFSLGNATFFFWRSRDSSVWKSSPNNLACYPLLGFLIGGFKAYLDWAEGYYEKSIDHDVLKDVFTSLTVNASQLSILNSELSLEDLEEDLNEILQ